MRDSASVLVPSSAAVAGMNWIRPVAPLPAALRTPVSKVPPVSKLITASRNSGRVPSRSAMASTSARNSGVTFGLPRTPAMRL